MISINITSQHLKQFLDAFSESDYKSFSELLHPSLQEAIPPEAFRKIIIENKFLSEDTEYLAYLGQVDRDSSREVLYKVKHTLHHEILWSLTYHESQTKIIGLSFR
ncbi:hypothetical protein ACKC9G_07835 [Pokkaliibacter sp. CJK22405]|uniref:hypothetical protein n=1 Tax=Pokkaliibacter sp. CJK22405 TaxID=3384615 RepID=UPI003984B4D8